MLSSSSFLVQAVATQANDSRPSTGDLLSMLLTAEGLLFAALAVSVALQSLSGATYLPRVVSTGALALAIAIVITLVAVGAGSAWYDLYGADFPPNSFSAVAISVGLASAVIAQPVLAFVIWRGSAR